MNLMLCRRLGGFILALALGACAQSSPKCGDDVTLSVVKKVIIEQIDGLEKLPAGIAEAGILVSKPIAGAYDEKIKKYSCQASIVSGDAYEIPVQYSAQLDDRGQLRVFVGGLTEGKLFALKLGLIKMSEQQKGAAVSSSEASNVQSQGDRETPLPQDLPSLSVGEQYGNVREKLIKSGWAPYRSQDADQCAPEDSRCENRPEMESCAGGGLASCRFLWKRDDKIVGVCTNGEEPTFASYCEG